MSLTGLEWEDFGLAPPTGTIYEIARYNVDIAPSALATLSNADRQAGVLSFEYALPAPESVMIQLYSGRNGVPPLDLMALTSFTVYGDTQVFVPVSFVAPNIFLRSIGASVDGYDLIVGYTTLSNKPNNVAMLKSPLAFNSAGTVAATTEEQLFPASCLPGTLATYFTTTATDYDVILRTWTGSTANDIIVANETSPLQVGALLTVPIGTYALVFVNNDATSSDYTLSAVYKPEG